MGSLLLLYFCTILLMFLYLIANINISLGTIVLNSREWSKKDGIHNLCTSKTHIMQIIQKWAKIYWYHHNDTVPFWTLLKFQCFVQYIILKVSKSGSIRLPTVRPGCASAMPPIFSHSKGNRRLFKNLLIQRQFIHCAVVFLLSFIT